MNIIISTLKRGEQAGLNLEDFKSFSKLSPEGLNMYSEINEYFVSIADKGELIDESDSVAMYELISSIEDELNSKLKQVSSSSKYSDNDKLALIQSLTIQKTLTREIFSFQINENSNK